MSNKQYGIALSILLSMSLFSTQQSWSATPDASPHYNSLVAATRIHAAMDDIKSQFGVAGVTDAYNNNDRGAALNNDHGNKEWSSFGFWAVATFGRSLDEHRESFAYDAYLLGLKEKQYMHDVNVKDHKGVANSKFDSGKLLVQIWWGDPSLFAYFGADYAYDPSLTQEQKDALVLSKQTVALEYAEHLEVALVQHEAYDVPYDLEEEHLPVIFLPGIGGTFLWSGSELVWPIGPAKTSQEYLILKEDGRSEYLHGSKISTGGIMRMDDSRVASALGKVSGTVADASASLDFYGSMMQFLVSKGYKEGKDLLAFPYDWRLDNFEHLKALDKVVDKLREKNNGKKVILVAHSMGGVIARAYANHDGASKVNTVITIGTPFYGSPKPYYALVNGYNFGAPVDTLLMKMVAQNAPAVYQLLPRVPFITHQTTKQMLSIADSFKIHYRDVAFPDLRNDEYHETDGVKEFNGDLVTLADEFHNMLGTKDHPYALPSGIKHYVIIGYGVATLDGYSIREARINEHSSAEFFGTNVVMEPKIDDGDGTVPLWSSEITGVTATYYIPYVNSMYSSAHGDLPKNPSVQKIVGDVIDKNAPPSESYKRAGNLKGLENITVFTLHSDAHLNIMEDSGRMLGVNSQDMTSETLGSGTFLSIDGVEYAAVTDTAKTYKVLVNGITDGKFTLSVNITQTGKTTIQTTTFLYPEVPVKRGTVAQFTISPREITERSIPSLEVSTGGQISSVLAKVEKVTTTNIPADNEPPVVAQPQQVTADQRTFNPAEAGSQIIQQSSQQIIQQGGQVVAQGSQAVQQAGEVLKTGSGCLIATAAFGSELTPQVQMLRGFRDQRIMSTLAGSSFMNVFNAWYYSFSPNVADYERGQPWLQTIVRAAIYPLLGILQISQSGYASMDGEYGAVTAGLIASSMIGALYFWPFAISFKRVRAGRFNHKLVLSIIVIASLAVIGSIISSNELALMASTSIFVLTMLSIAAVLSANMISRLVQRFWSTNMASKHEINGR